MDKLQYVAPIVNVLKDNLMSEEVIDVTTVEQTKNWINGRAMKQGSGITGQIEYAGVRMVNLQKLCDVILRRARFELVHSKKSDDMLSLQRSTFSRLRQSHPITVLRPKTTRGSMKPY